MTCLANAVLRFDHGNPSDEYCAHGSKSWLTVMRPNRTPIERRESVARVVVDRTPRTDNRPAFTVLGLSLDIGFVYLLASGLPSVLKNIEFDSSSDSLVTQMSDALSDSPPRSQPAPDPFASLHTAIIKADVPGITATLEHVSRAELNRPLNGMTTLMTAASIGNAKVLRALLAHGADPNALGAHQRIALQYAAEKNRSRATQLLLDAGADINGADNGSLAPLIMAAERNHTKRALLLIERGANVNVQNIEGWTALMAAAEAGNLQRVNALLAAGARTAARHRDGSMALDFARRGKHQDVIQVLFTDVRTSVTQTRPADRNQPATPGKKGERQ